MLKRILSLSVGMVVGTLIAMGLLHVVELLGLRQDAELRKASTYYRQVLQLVQEQYVDEAAAEDVNTLTREALVGMMENLDPHSSYLRASDFAHLQEDLDSQFGGIGVQIERREDQVVVVAPIAGTPGERAGILRGDVVLAVEGESMRGKTLNEVVERMRGKPGTSVQVSFGREGVDEPIELTIVREFIRVESVTDVRMLEGNIGYVRIVQFSEPTAEEMHAALAQLLGEGARALIIDVRNNPGGLLTSAADVLEPFFERGDLLVYTQGRQAEDREELRSRNEKDPIELPMAVLINAGSASAAEILAGALKDTGKAVVVGERSFGKGSVQTLFRLNEGEALRLTTARYYTPGGETIHERGVPPDVEVIMSPDEDRNVALQRLRPDLNDPAAFEERFGIAPVADRQLDAAQAILEAALLIEQKEEAAQP
ncbi:S41 family peptidase [Actomonas aquatica]|uniref:S41 family peptidase n=1 Tax=Actomonas aquatica TaxID=2866162 RepID=A0ABZ1CBI7_9BACT|nr:S41 family peptidase [Opitutus sp. WL0086]WRQ88954.1 S41 family peptidase [Opitutus sp. WL0086]